MLGVPKIGCRNDNEQAEACLRTLDDWGLRTSESSSWYMVYDITASNTRLKNDACTFIEKSNLARINLDDFRHHVMELPLAVFGSLSGPTGGFEITMLSRFKQSWPHIDQATNEMASDDIFDAHTSALREEMVKFFKAALEGSHQREDFEEFLKLSLIFRVVQREQEFPFRHQEHSIMHI